MKTFSPKAHEVKHNWYIVDAADAILGRLASEVARRLRGKHKAEFSPHMDMGDFIIVTNAGKIQVTGKKRTDKIYYRHSGYPGGIKSITFEKQLVKDPTKIIELAVKGMLPNNPLGRAMLRKLKVYSNTEHPHAAQQPQVLKIGSVVDSLD
ncbi:MAG: 50S ribosomal protein L13 [Gammaproteobacteria bacterium]